MSQTIRGQCLCGAVAYAARVPSLNVDACHCSMCRRWTGGPMMTLEHVGPMDFKGSEHIGRYASSDAIERGFCNQCGSALFTKLKNADHYFLSAGTLDDTGDLKFAVEIFIDDKPPYYAFANDTKKMTGAEFMAAWADTSDQT